MKDWLPKSPRFRYFRCCVLDAPSDIPDGRYVVYFEEHCAPAVKQGGLWLPEDHVRALLRSHPPQVSPAPFRIEDAIEILPLLKNQVA